VIFSWLNHVLCDQPIATSKDADERAKVIAVFRRYGGAAAAAKAQALLEVAPIV
jgi:hypothetical protein